MGLLNKIRGKKKKDKEVEAKKSLSDLELLCSDDPEVYEALRETMFLDPRKIEYSMEEALEKAKEAEKAKNYVNAIFWYRIAGGLAIYHGDVEKVKRYFGKLTKLMPGLDLKIVEIPDKAVKKAKEYYEKYLKPQQEEETLNL